MPFLSLHGRMIGYDTVTGALQRPGFKDFFDDEEDVTAASTAASIKWRGNTTTNSTAAKTYALLAPPAAGLVKTISAISTSTLARIFALASGNFQTTAGSSFTGLTFTGIGQNVTLIALSTALVQVSANAGVTST